MSSHANRSTRLEARISPQALTMVKRAAEIQGRSVSDFVISAAHEAAQKAIEDAHIIRLSVADQKALAESILNPPAPSRALKRTKAAHARLVVKSR